MDLSKYLIWTIPNHEEGSYKEEIYGEVFELGKEDHRDFCKKFIATHNLEHKGGESHLDYAKTLVENGFSVVFNSGVKVNGKYFCSIFLPEELSVKQLEIFDSQKEIFNEKYHHEASMFPVLVGTNSSLDYKSSYEGFRDLNIEAIISRKEYKNDGYLELYNHIDEMKWNIGNKKKL